MVGWEKEDNREKKIPNRKGKEREGEGSVGTRRKKNDPSRTKWLRKVVLAGLLGRAQSMIAIGILTRETTPFQGGEWGMGAPAHIYNPRNYTWDKTPLLRSETNHSTSLMPRDKSRLGLANEKQTHKSYNPEIIKGYTPIGLHRLPRNTGISRYRHKQTNTVQ